MKRALALVIAVIITASVGFLIYAFTLTSADAQQVGLPPVFIEETIRGEPGSEHQVAVIDVPDEFIGQVCDVTIIGANNDSVHPGSNIILRGGTTEVVIPDVEAVAGEVISGTGRVTVVATEIDVFVQLGPDGVFSGAATEITAVCELPPPATTTSTPSTTTPIVPTTPPVTQPPTLGLPHTL